MRFFGGIFRGTDVSSVCPRGVPPLAVAAKNAFFRRLTLFGSLAISFCMAAAGCCPLCKSSASVVEGRWIEFDRQAVNYRPEDGGITVHQAIGRAAAEDLPDGRAIAGNQKADCCLYVVMSPAGRQAFLVVEHPVLLAGEPNKTVYTIYQARDAKGMPGDYSMISACGDFITRRVEFFGAATRPANERPGRQTDPAAMPADQPQLRFIIPRQLKESRQQQRQTLDAIQSQFGRVLSCLLHPATPP
ncbi:MAG: hypothetical protein HZA50_11155 [Planctomycetes bacterium]|nr:hypothetical protein [Planctomycetota bacterium]